VERLPLFPLRTVLFPHAALPLHVFEERYKIMIGRCIDARAPFGVVLIRSGEEVGAPAEPHDVGTSARIAQVQRLSDDRMNLIAYGERRFRIHALDTTQPYLQADIEFLTSEDVAAPAVAELATRVTDLFREHQRLVLAISGQWAREPELPADADRLADYVAGAAELPMEARQELLETLSLPERLNRLAVLLDERVRSLTEMWEEKRRTKFAAN
jgi:Lon protease-like protein